METKRWIGRIIGVVVFMIGSFACPSVYAQYAQTEAPVRLTIVFNPVQNIMVQPDPDDTPLIFNSFSTPRIGTSNPRPPNPTIFSTSAYEIVVDALNPLIKPQCPETPMFIGFMGYSDELPLFTQLVYTITAK